MRTFSTHSRPAHQSLDVRKAGSVGHHLSMTQGDLTAFWTAVATVLPVIALATIVEARTISARWRDLDIAHWYIYIQTLLWAFVLVGGVFAEGWALGALGGAPQAEWKTTLAKYAVSGGLGIMVLSPTLELVLSGWAGPISSVLTIHPLRRAKRARIRRGHERFLAKLEKQATQYRKRIGEVRASSRECRELRAQTAEHLAGFERAKDVGSVELVPIVVEWESRSRQLIETLDRALLYRDELVTNLEDAAIKTLETQIETKKIMREIAELERGERSANKKRMAEFLRDQDAAIAKMKGQMAEIESSEAAGPELPATPDSERGSEDGDGPSPERDRIDPPTG